ncbi:MAG: hypothetical protein LDL39_12525 [Magnetospirillum sp.]|nr:hypothetical protein [Magnetospirillum sp.]
MFMVKLETSRDEKYQPLTVDGPQYLYEFAAFIARTVPDAEVHARLGGMKGDEVVFKGQDLVEDDVELF